MKTLKKKPIIKGLPQWFTL